MDQRMRVNGTVVGFVSDTTTYFSERYRSEGHRYENKNGYAVSETILDALPSTVERIVIRDVDVGKLYVYDIEDFLNGELLNHEDPQRVVTVYDADRYDDNKLKVVA